MPTCTTGLDTKSGCRIISVQNKAASAAIIPDKTLSMLLLPPRLPTW